MANKTLLNAVNEILRKKGLIAGDSALLASLTDSARQSSIDLAIQVINEGIDEIYSTVSISLPSQLKEATLTLATGTRAYVLATDLVRLHFPFRDRTNLQRIYEYAGGYEGLLDLDLGQVNTGLPRYGAIRQTDGYIFLDRAPTSAENARVYYYEYDKDTVLTILTDNVPFNDEVFRAMVPVWAQMWERQKRTQAYDEVAFRASLGRAARLLTEKPMRDSYNPRVGASVNSTDPMAG